MKKTHPPIKSQEKSRRGKKHVDRVWTWYQSYVPCHVGCVRHYPCFLWETGSRVRVRKFLFFKWLEMTKEWYET